MTGTPQSRRRLAVNALFIFTAALIVWGISTLTRHRTPQDSVSTTHVVHGDSLSPIRILVDLSPEDFGVKEGGKMDGLQVRMAERLFDGLVIRWLPVTDRSTALATLRAGEADIYAGAFPLSHQVDLESEGVAVSLPLFDSSFVLISRMEAPEPTEAYTTDSVCHIAVSQDDLSAQIVLANMIEIAYPHLQMQVTPSSELDLILSTIRGEYSYAVANKELASEMIDRYPDDIKKVQDISFDTRQVWLVQPGDSTMLRLLNDKITENLGRK